MKAKTRKQPHLGTCEATEFFFFFFCTCPQMTLKALQVSILRLQIRFREWVNFQIMEPEYNEDLLYHMLSIRMVF